jgi:hypothetical protein
MQKDFSAAAKIVVQRLRPSISRDIDHSVLPIRQGGVDPTQGHILNYYA